MLLEESVKRAIINFNRMPTDFQEFMQKGLVGKLVAR